MALAGRDLDQRRLTPALIRRGMRVSIAEGVTANVILGLLAGNFLIGVLLHWGAANWQVGLAAAVPLMMVVFQLPASVYVSRRERIVGYQALVFTLHRLCWSLAGLVPLLLPAPARVPAFLVMFTVSWALSATGSPAWQVMISELVPAQERGSYFGRRSAYGQGAVLVTVLAGGWLLDHLGEGRGFTVLYLGALGATVLNTIVFLMHPEPPRQPAAGSVSLLTPLRRPDFRAALLVFALWNFAQALPTAFYPVRMIRDLHLSYSTMSTLATIASLVTVGAMTAWGRWCDRVGEGRVLAIVLPAFALVPAGWLLVGVGGLPLLVVLHVMQAAGLAGLQFTFMTMSMHLAPQQGRAFYLSVWGVVGGVAGGIAPLVGGWLTSVLPVTAIGSGRFDALDSVFALAAVLMGLLALVWQRRQHTVRPGLRPS